MGFSQYDFKWTGREGEQDLTAGSEGQTRLGKQGDLAVNIAGRWYELARKGRIFSATTAVAGVAPGTSIGTTGAAALYNPSGASTDMVVIKASMSYVSGTLGIGVVDWIGHLDPSQAAITGTAMVKVNGNLRGGDPTGRAFTTATVPSGGSVFRLFANLPPMLATSVLTPWRLDDPVDGAIILAPGTGVSLQGTAAGGSTPLVRFNFVWAEVPTSF